MSSVLELREKRNKVWNTAKEFLAERRGPDGLVSAEAAAEYDRMESEMVALGKEIDRLDRQRALDDELARPTTSPILADPVRAEVRQGRAADAYRADFANILRGKAPKQCVEYVAGRGRRLFGALRV